MICIHPTATHSQAALASLQIATGLRVAHGQRHLRLVNHDGSTPACKPAPKKTAPRFTTPNPWGGDAA